MPKKSLQQRDSSGRKPGGQKGHRGITRRNVPPNEVTETIAHKPQSCEQCGTSFTEQNPSVPVERRQVLEIPEIKPLVQEHVFYQTACGCGHPTRLPVPEWIYSGAGKNLQAHITYFTADAKLSRRTLQTVLWAHIIRDLKALQNELAFESDQIFSVVMRKRLGAVFRLWHACKRGKISRAQLIAAAEPLIAEMRAFVAHNQQSPCREVAKFNRQLLKRWNSLFTFIYHEGVEPTNNLSREAGLIRPGVQTRKISYCTRSENGQLLRARLLTVSQTCRIQQRNALDFYRTAISAHRHHLTRPSLLTTPQEPHSRMAA